MAKWQELAKQSLDRMGYVAPENRTYEITLNDGEKLGEVSYSAYQAVKNNTLDSYTPKNDAEKKTLEDFKNYATVYSADTVSGGLKYNSEIGQFGKGNIDLYNRPQHKNDDGTVSTVRSATFEIDGKYVVLPTVVYDGKSGRETSKILSDEEAVEHYKQTGQYLGKFDTLYEADIYAQKLHLAQDFYYGSKYKTTKNGKETELSVWIPGLVIESGYDDLTYDVINKNEDAKSIQLANDIALNATIAGVDKGFLQTMTDDEVAVFNYIYSTQGADKAYEFINDISADLNYRQRVKTEKMWADEAAKAPVKMSAFSVLISPLKMASYVGQVADYVDDGSIDQNAGYNKHVHIPNAIRNEVSTQIENSRNWGTVGSYAYNIGMSMADSLYNTAISGGQQWLSLAIMGTGAAADTTVAAKDRGLSDTQAFWLGTISGAGEIISEKMSFDAIMDADLFTQSARKYFVRSATVGGLEEVVADGINFAADTIIAGDKSLWSQSIKSYMQQGKTKSEAVGLTLGNKLLETALSFAGGALSTGVMSLGGTVYNTSRIRDVGKQYNSSDDISKVIEKGLKQPTDSAAYQNAVKLQEKMKSGTLTDFEIGQQVLLNEGATVSDEAEVAETKVNRAKKLIDKFSSYIHKSDTTATDTTVETSTPIADETETVTESTVAEPHAENVSSLPVSVGDAFSDTLTGNTIRIVSRDENNTVVEIDTGSETERRTYTNSQADTLITNNQYEQIASAQRFGEGYNIQVGSASTSEAKPEKNVALTNKGLETEADSAILEAGNTTIESVREGGGISGEGETVPNSKGAYWGHDRFAETDRTEQSNTMDDGTDGESRTLQHRPEGNDLRGLGEEDTGNRKSLITKSGGRLEYTELSSGKHTNVMRNISEGTKRFGVRTIFVDGPMKVYDDSGAYVREVMDGTCEGDCIFVNANSGYNLNAVSTHEMVHLLNRRDAYLYDSLCQGVFKCIYISEFFEYVDAYMKLAEVEYGQVDSDVAIEEILANLSYEIYSNNIPEYVMDVEGVKRAYESFWKAAEDAAGKAKERTNDGKSELEGAVEVGGERQQIHSNGSETGNQGVSQEVSRASDAVRGGSTAYDELYRAAPSSDSGRAEAGSQQENMGGNTEARDDSERERQVSGVEKETSVYTHLYDEEKVSKEYLDSVNSEIENAIISIRNGDTDSVSEVIKVTELDEKTIKAISDFVGYDVSGYVCKIERDRLVHIENRHGINGQHDQSLSDPKDTARMGYVVNNSDNIEWAVDDKGNRIYDAKYNDRHNKTAPVFVMEKRIDGTYTVSQVVPDSKRKTLWITSARIEKAAVGSQVPNADNSPQPTPETPLVSSSAFGSIVSQDGDTVNNSVRNDTENDTPSKSIALLENKLKESGADAESRRDILTTAGVLEESLKGNSKSVNTVVSGMIKLTNNIAKTFEKSIGAPQDYWSLLSANLKAVSTADSVFDTAFIKAYTSAFSETIKRNDNETYRALSEGGSDVAHTLADYVLEGKIPDKLTNASALETASEAFKDIVKAAARQISAAHAQLYGGKGGIQRQASAIQNNDFSLLNQNGGDLNDNQRNVSGRDNLSGRDSGRQDGVGAAEHDGGLSENTRGQRVSSNARARRTIAESLRRSGHTNKRELDTTSGKVVYEEIGADRLRGEPEAERVVSANQKRGFKTVFFTGLATVGTKTTAHGFEIDGTAYVQFDHPVLAPSQINEHENVHLCAKTKAFSTLLNKVKAALSADEQQRLYDATLERYMGTDENSDKPLNVLREHLKKNNPHMTDEEINEMVDAYIWEEIIANLNGNMNEMAAYSEQFADDVEAFRKAIETEQASETATAADVGSRANSTPAEYKNVADAGGMVNFAIGYTTDDEPVVMLNDDIFKDKNGKRKEGKEHQIIASYIGEHIGDYYILAESGQKVYIGEDLPGEYTQSEYTRWLLHNRKRLLNIKNQTAQNFREVIEIATERKWNKNAKDKHKVDAKYGFYKYSSKVAIPVKDAKGNIVRSNVYDVELLIRNDANGKKYLYDIQDIKKNVKQLSSTWKPKSDIEARHSIDRVPQNGTSVNTYSMQNSESHSTDKNKSQQWTTSRGLQLPKLVQSTTDNDSILQKEDIVNDYSIPKSQNNSSARFSVENPEVSQKETAESRKLLLKDAKETHQKAHAQQQRLNSIMREIAKEQELPGCRGKELSVQELTEAVSAEKGVSSVAEIPNHVRGIVLLKDYTQAPKALGALVRELGAANNLRVELQENQETGAIKLELAYELDGVNARVQVGTARALELQRRSEAVSEKWSAKDIQNLAPAEEDEYLSEMGHQKAVWEWYLRRENLDVEALAEGIEAALPEGVSLNREKAGNSIQPEEMSLETAEAIDVKSVYTEEDIERLKSILLTQEERIVNRMQGVLRSQGKDTTGEEIADKIARGMLYGETSGEPVIDVMASIIQERLNANSRGELVIVPEQEVDTEFLARLSKLTGREVKVGPIRDSETGGLVAGAEGMYDRETGAIMFSSSLTRTEILRGVAMHELTHMIEESPYYQDYFAYVKEKLSGNDEGRWQERIAELQGRRAEFGIETSREQAERELVADYTRYELFDSVEAVEDLLERNERLAKRIYQAIRRLLSRIRELFGRKAEGLAELERGRRLFEEALGERKRSGFKGSESRISTDTTAAYSVRESDKRIEAGNGRDIGSGTNGVAKSEKESIIGSRGGERAADNSGAPYSLEDRKHLSDYTSDKARDILSRQSLSQAELDRLSFQHTTSEIVDYIADINEYTKAHDTSKIKTESREKYREMKAAEYYEKFRTGATERKAFIVIGLPASGKSTISETIARDENAMILDSDIIKEGDKAHSFDGIPEYGDGIGVSAVHDESGFIADGVMEKILKNGDNVVYPKLGGKVDGIKDIVQGFKNNGFTVSLVLNDLPIEKVFERDVARFRETGRLVTFDILTNCNYGPINTYNTLKEEGLCDGYEVYDNDVRRGEKASLVEKIEAAGSRESDALRENGRNRHTVLERVESTTGSELDSAGKVNALPDIHFSADEGGTYDVEHIFDDDDVSSLFDELIKKYGAVEKGERPGRDVSIPKRTSENRYVSKFARTMMEAKVTPDDAVSEFEKLILEGKMTHEPITNASARKDAVDKIKERGFDGALNHWTELSLGGKIGKKELALGMELYNQCVTNKDIPNAMKIAAELAAEATRAGQSLQALRMLKLMSPDGQLYYLEMSVQKMNEEFRAKLGKKHKNIELVEGLMEEFFNARDEESRNAAYDKICQNIADQIPATFLDKWNSWRYLSMLGNPRTHFRNIAGNAIFVPAIRIKNYIGAVIESVARINPESRTKSFKKTKEAVSFAKKDFEAMKKALQGENAKYAVTGDIEGKRTIFKTKWLEKVRTKNFDFLELEDLWFLKMHYVDALARIITARRIDVSAVDSTALENARAYALKEAQAATYRDANVLADGLTKLQRGLERSDNKVIRALGALTEGVMPFKKTPMNIAKQGVQYSPAGILNGVYKGLRKLKNGQAYSATEVIDDIAKGLTGTGVMLLGFFLASLGLLSGADDEDEKKKAFDEMVGEQSYALKIGDKSYTIDWATPLSLPLFTGAELQRLTTDTGFSFKEVVDAITTLPEPLLELSVFSGVSKVISSAKYSETDPVFAIISNMTINYLTQALPAVGGQLSRIIDPQKREYYYPDKNGILPRGMQNVIGQAASKIPFASLLFEPSVDEWGREETYGGLIERTVENIASPGFYSEENYTAVDAELKKLFDRTGESAVLPIIQEKYYKEGGVVYHMSASEYTEAQKLRGSRSFELINALLKNEKVFKNQSKSYSSMTDEEKVKAIKKCYEQAGEEAREAMLEKLKRKAK